MSPKGIGSDSLYIGGVFHWICPECGREIGPMVRECPECDPTAPVLAAVLAGVAEASLSVAETVMVAAPKAPSWADAIPLRLSLPQASIRGLLSAGSHVDLPLTIPAFQNTLDLAAIFNAVREAEEARLAAEAAPTEGPAPKQPMAKPDAREIPYPPALQMELVPFAGSAIAPMNREAHVTWQSAAPMRSSKKFRIDLRINGGTYLPSGGAEPLQLPAASAPLPSSGKPSLELAMAELQDYSPLEGHTLRPAVPEWKVMKLDSGPRETLPAPHIPDGMTCLEDGKIITPLAVKEKPEQKGMPGWMMGVLAGLMMLTAGVAGFSFLVPHASVGATTQAAKPPAVAVPAVRELPSPVAKFIEVTGVRLTLNSTQQFEAHYLVVNHSAAELPEAKVNVTIRSADAVPGAPPVSQFSFQTPSLGPFESRELSGIVDNPTKALTAPEWKNLRAEVQFPQ